VTETSETPAPVDRTFHVGVAAVGMRIVIARGLSLEYVGDMEDGAEMWEVASDTAEAEETA